MSPLIAATRPIRWTVRIDIARFVERTQNARQRVSDFVGIIDRTSPLISPYQLELTDAP
jgi:hypothetical protein